MLQALPYFENRSDKMQQLSLKNCGICKLETHWSVAAIELACIIVTRTSLKYNGLRYSTCHGAETIITLQKALSQYHIRLILWLYRYFAYIIHDGLADQMSFSSLLTLSHSTVSLWLASYVAISGIGHVFPNPLPRTSGNVDLEVTWGQSKWRGSCFQDECDMGLRNSNDHHAKKRNYVSCRPP